MRNFLVLLIFFFCFNFSLLGLLTNEDQYCVAKGIYFESANQSEIGQIAVGHVILNRMRDKKMSACQVIYEKDYRGRKQFLWDHTKKIPTTDKRYPKIVEISKNIEKLPDPTGGATFFHSNKVHPNWKKLTFTVRIGDHLFYRK